MVVHSTEEQDFVAVGEGVVVGSRSRHISLDIFEENHGLIAKAELIDFVAGGRSSEHVECVADAGHGVPIEVVELVVEEVVLLPRDMVVVEFERSRLIEAQNQQVIEASEGVGNRRLAWIVEAGAVLPLEDELVFSLGEVEISVVLLFEDKFIISALQLHRHLPIVPGAQDFLGLLEQANEGEGSLSLAMQLNCLIGSFRMDIDDVIVRSVIILDFLYFLVPAPLAIDLELVLMHANWQTHEALESNFNRYFNPSPLLFMTSFTWNWFQEP